MQLEREVPPSGWILVSMATRVPGPWHTQQEMLQISTALSFTRNKSPVAILNVWESKNILCARVCVRMCVRAHAWMEIGLQNEDNAEERNLVTLIDKYAYVKYNNIFLLQIEAKQLPSTPKDTELKENKSIFQRKTTDRNRSGKWLWKTSWPRILQK